MNRGFLSLAAELLYSYGDSASEAELKFYEAAIRNNGGLALDVACGVGRHAIALASRGLAVHGADASADALQFAVERARARGLDIPFHHQSMEEMSLPHRFGTIYIPNGSFHCVAERAQACEVLRRFHHHLAPGGQLLMELDPPHRMDAQARQRSPQNPRIAPTMPRVSGPGTIAVKVWVEHVDRFEQVMIEKREYQLWANNSVQRSELHTLRLRCYSKYEMELMLERAGFTAVEWFGDFAPHQPGDESYRQLVCAARRS